MGDKAILWLCIPFCCCYIWGFSILGVLLHAAKTNWAFESVDDSKITNIRNDWSTTPFVDIKVVEIDNALIGMAGSDCPIDYPDEVISSHWLGETIGCNCL